MSKRLEDIVGLTGVAILRDIYIQRVHDDELQLRYGVTRSEIRNVLDKVKRHLVYDARSQNYNIQTSKISFSEPQLVKWVWREYILQKIDEGYTTGELSLELEIDL